MHDVSRSVENAIDQNDLALDLVKGQIVVDDEGAISERCEFGIVGHATGERVGRSACNRASIWLSTSAAARGFSAARYETSSTKSCSAMERRRTVYLLEGTDALSQVSHDTVERAPSVAGCRLCLRHGQLPIEL